MFEARIYTENGSPKLWAKSPLLADHIEKYMERMAARNSQVLDDLRVERRGYPYQGTVWAMDSFGYDVMPVKRGRWESLARPLISDEILNWSWIARPALRQGFTILISQGCIPNAILKRWSNTLLASVRDTLSEYGPFECSLVIHRADPSRDPNS